MPAIGRKLRMTLANIIIASLIMIAAGGTDSLLAAEKKPAETKVKSNPNTDPKINRHGICFVLYTVHNSTLKLTAQLYPLKEQDSREAHLEIKVGGAWKPIKTASVRENPYAHPKRAKSWTAHFRVEQWDTTRSLPYRVVICDGSVSYQGIVRKDPVDKEEIVIAAFTGNSNADKRLKPDIIKNVKTIDADLLFFSGDQVYTHRNHLDDWLRFGEQFGEITRDRPTVCIPDDHDVGQGNLWGDRGRKAEGGMDNGGYVMPAYHVNEVQWAQTSHLPDPVDPEPVEQGIGVYFTRLTVGRVDFAIIEDRKFKTGKRVLPKGYRNIPTKDWDVKEARLLGDRQLKFLNDWSVDWTGTDMKCVLSQTLFAAAHTGRTVSEPKRDVDTNGWPQTGRNRALRAMRKGFAFHISGDQHLATVLQYGIDDWNDAGYSFSVQSIVNYFPRYWLPQNKPEKTVDSTLKYAGSFYDAFGNRLTMHAYANPEFGIKNYRYVVSDKNPLRGADGFGVVRFNKKQRTITMECWPRLTDVSKPDAEQYDGWPITVTQADNYGREAVAWLPELALGTPNPVVTVIDQATNDVVYAIRIKGNTFQPKVFTNGTYTVMIDDGQRRMIKDLKSGSKAAVGTKSLKR